MWTTVHYAKLPPEVEYAHFWDDAPLYISTV